MITCHLPLVTCHLPLPAAHPRHQAFAQPGHVIQRQPASAFLRAAAAERDEPGQAAVGGAIGRPENQRRHLLRRDLRADDEFHAKLLGGHVGADHAGQAVAIGHRHGRIAQLGGAIHQFLRMRRAFEEGEVRLGVKFGVHGGEGSAVMYICHGYPLYSTDHYQLWLALPPTMVL